MAHRMLMLYVDLLQSVVRTCRIVLCLLRLSCIRLILFLSDCDWNVSALHLSFIEEKYYC